MATIQASFANAAEFFNSLLGTSKAQQCVLHREGRQRAGAQPILPVFAWFDPDQCCPSEAKKTTDVIREQA
jgi:hypothetical protein